jgi:hypothetical protein
MHGTIGDLTFPRWKIRLYRFMRVKPICNLVFWVRYFWLARILRRIKMHPDLQAVGGLERSRSGVFSGKPSDRILKLIMPMSIIDRLNDRSKILAIGVRYETDLLYLSAYGLPNCRGLDLFSYSPWVDLGNMHSMEYQDSEFDAVLMGWTLAYSDDQQKAASEILRVTRNGGIVAISNSYYPKEVLERPAFDGDPVGKIGRRQTVADILQLFDGHVELVYFQHDANPEKQGACLVVFAVKK